MENMNQNLGNRDDFVPILPELPTEADIVKPQANELELTESHLPIEQFGAMAKRYANALSHGFRVSQDLIVGLMLVSVAEAANRKLTVSVGNYTNHASLWLSIVEPSGYNKSEPMARVFRPLEAINRDLVNSYQKAFASWRDSGEKGFPPPKNKIIISDSTAEIRNELLRFNGLLLARDEIHGMLKDFNRYNASGEVEQLLSVWSGGGFAVDRKTSGSYYVENPFLCICGGIQPSMLREAFGGRGFEGSGFLARWLFLWPKDSKIPDSIVESQIDSNVENEWFAWINNIWRMPPTEFRLDREAMIGYQSYMAKTAGIMNDPSCEDSLRAMMAKLRIYALRLVLTIHLLRNGKFAPQFIDRRSMDAALRCCDCFRHWGERTMAIIQDSGEPKRISNAALIRELVERFEIKNQSELSRVLGKSQQYVNKILKQ